MRVTQAYQKLKKLFLLGLSGLFLFVVFLLDVVRKSIETEVVWLSILRHILVIAAFILFYFYIEILWKRDQSPAKKLGFALVLSLIVGAAVTGLYLIPFSDFDVKNSMLIPLGFDSTLWSDIYGVILGATSIILLMLIRDIIFSKRKRGTKRNFIILLGLIGLRCAIALTMRPMESSVTAWIVLSLAICAMLMNSFRLSWIVYLSKREKLFSITYAFLLFSLFIGFDILTMGGGTLSRVLAYYSSPLRSFVICVNLFATIYFGMTFVSTLFHLPTAEAFDRKISEVSSLHNLGKLITQVLDFNELVDSVTSMTMQVCEAKSAWLEILTPHPTDRLRLRAERKADDGETFQSVGLKNITEDEVSHILNSNGESIRRLAYDSRKAIVIDEVMNDRRTSHLAGLNKALNSMVIVPLVSQDRVIGILYATKDLTYGFDQDDVEVISAFADQATIAIENSRLIESSMERERLVREMTLAQDMQRKLLPQKLPKSPKMEIEALSTPAFEVGGDYYDFTMLDEYHLGVLVGDVSGKGVSAAFYMAEMKGIFQSLSKISASPKDFLTRAHVALADTIDKKSFISLVYAVIDLRDGSLTVARAGHCPLLHISTSGGHYVKPTGLALGMGTSEFFRKTITEEQFPLHPGDVIVMYTDGLTEAHPREGEEFGFENLLMTVQRAAAKSAVEVRDAIIEAIDTHMHHESPEDDLTIVVVKWRGSPTEHHSPGVST
jgi:serine phosphatase RsbU (regulator of sigma subunit)